MAAKITAVEDIYQHQPTNNGANPFWCFGSTTLVSTPGGELFATSFEKTEEAVPWLNAKWSLWRRGKDGWKKIHQDSRRTREPVPMAVLPGQNLGLISTNPTLTPPDKMSGPAAPEALTFTLDAANPEGTLVKEAYAFPVGHYFGEHSYRSFAADARSGEVIELHQVDQGDQVWSLRDANGQWGYPGKLEWPWGADYAEPQAIRICYPSVLLDQRSFYFCGVSDIVEPNAAWREAKFKVSGQKWDYDFRRLFFTWTKDITSSGFAPWVEVASREATCGWIYPCDMTLNPEAAQSVTVMWVERALDVRIRDEFFPGQKQSWSLNAARVTEGKVEATHRLMQLDEDQPGTCARFARFHQTIDGRRFVLASVGDPRATPAMGAQNHCTLVLMELNADGGVKSTQDLGHTVAQPLFFVASARAGCPASNTIHVLAEGEDRWVKYLRIEIEG